MEDMANMELRCPRCSYIRQHKKTGEHDYFKKECPRCGIIYEKYEAYLTRRQAKQGAENNAERSTTQVSPVSKKVADRILKAYLFIKNLTPYLFRRFRQNETLDQLLSRLKNSRLIQWISWNRDTISSIDNIY